MAGLQYYFFPTDFFYPRPPSVNAADGASSAAATKTSAVVSAEQALERDVEGDHDHGVAKHRAILHRNKMPQASVSTALVKLSPCKVKADDLTSTSKTTNNLAHQYWNFSG